AELHQRAYGAMDRFDLHGSTFAGFGLGCAAALETLAVLEDEALLDNARARGEELVAGLRRRLAGHPLVREVRGQGLLVGLELGPTDRGLLNRLAPSLVELVSRQVFGQWAALRLPEQGVVAQPASQHWDVLRLEPPLTIRPAQVERLVDTVAGILERYTGLAALLGDASARLGKQLARGWRF